MLRRILRRFVRRLSTRRCRIEVMIQRLHSTSVFTGVLFFSVDLPYEALSNGPCAASGRL
jgi:hypothetical protein